MSSESSHECPHGEPLGNECYVCYVCRLEARVVELDESVAELESSVADLLAGKAAQTRVHADRAEKLAELRSERNDANVKLFKSFTRVVELKARVEKLEGEIGELEAEGMALRHLLDMPIDSAFDDLKITVAQLKNTQTPRPMSETPPDGPFLGWCCIHKVWGMCIWDAERGGWWSDKSGHRIATWLPCPPDPEEKP